MAADILPIGMNEMNLVFDVVDDLEISRESIQVELLRSGPGTVERLPGGKIRIVLPESVNLEAWRSILASELGDIHNQPEEVES